MKYVAFAGIDGSGKSTQFTRASDYLSKENVNFTSYNYSSKDNYIGKLISNLHKSSNLGSRIIENSFIREFLYAQNAKLNLKKIKPDLKTADLLISDRSVLTAFASHYGKIHPRVVSFMEPKIYPDVIFYFDVSPEIAYQRIMKREEMNIRFDESIDELKSFKKGYENVFQEMPFNKMNQIEIKRINGEKSIDEVTQEVIEELQGVINGTKKIAV